MTTKLHVYSLPLTLLMAAAFCPASAQAQSQEQNIPSLNATEASNHNTYRLPKPADFDSIDNWITANYTDHIVPGTIIHGIKDDHEIVTFWIIQESGIYDHQIIAEENDILILQTTADLDISPDGGGSIQPRANSIKSSTMASTATNCNTTSNACDCVFYARCIVPSFPRPATYYSEKIRSINSNTPRIGSVAIMNISAPYGHVAVVSAIGKDRSGNIIVTLNESNYVHCKITTTRTGTPASMKIVGYYQP